MVEQNNNQNVSIPKSVTLGGVTYNVGETPELQSLIQAVSSVEKSKLYSKFENLRKQIEELQNVQIVDDKQKNTDVKSLAEQIKNDIKAELLPSIKEEIQSVVQPLLNSANEAKEKELNDYREKLINENLATCIPELVKGNTKQELDEALKKSIELRAKYPSANVPPANNNHIVDPNLQKQAQNAEFRAESPTNPIFANNGNHAQSVKPTAPTIPPVVQQPDANYSQPSAKQMSMKEFSSKRDSLLSQLQAEYGGGNSL